MVHDGRTLVSKNIRRRLHSLPTGVVWRSRLKQFLLFFEGERHFEAIFVFNLVL